MHASYRRMGIGTFGERELMGKGNDLIDFLIGSIALFFNFVYRLKRIKCKIVKSIELFGWTI